MIHTTYDRPDVKTNVEATITNVETIIKNIWFGKFNQQVVCITFGINDGTSFTQEVTASLHELSTFSKIVKAATGNIIDKYSNYDESNLIGKTVIGDLVKFENKGKPIFRLRNFQ